MLFLALVESILRFVCRRDARRTVPELRVLAVLANGAMHTRAVADALGEDPRLVKDWLEMAADDGLVLECGWARPNDGIGGNVKMWRIAPDGEELMRRTLAAIQDEKRTD